MSGTPRLMHIRRALMGIALLSLSFATVPTVAAETLTLKEAASDDFLIGCPVGVIDLGNPELLEMILEQFNCITVETELMTFKLGADRNDFGFKRADRVVEWVQANNLPLLGHMLLWDYRVPDWMFEDESGAPLPREKGLENLRFYIHKVVERYEGKVDAWNVVNEALSDEPGEYLRDTAALRSIGPDYVARAFQFAHEADPEVELYYNDYNIEEPEKREKALRLIRSLKEEGLRIDAIGIQGHWMINYPELAHIDEAIEAYVAEGLKVLVTELDVDVLPRTVSGANMTRVEEGPNPYPDGLPESVAGELADRYYELFATLAKHPEVESVTFWGSHDGRSWLNNFPVIGRTNYPLLFDRQLQKKEAYYAAIEALSEGDESSPQTDAEEAAE